MSKRGKSKSPVRPPTYNDKQDSESETSSAAFRQAKHHNGIPTAQHPLEHPKRFPDTNNKGKFCIQYEFENDYGERISIRKDNAVDYKGEHPEGNQPGHYNAGLAGQKLKQHHNFKRENGEDKE